MAKRMMLVGSLITLAAATADGQTPLTAVGCRQEGATYQTKTINDDRAANRTPDVPAIVAESKRITRVCADKISIDSVSTAELAALSALYVAVGDTVKARSIVATALARTPKSEADRADAVIAAEQLAVSSFDPFAGINRDAEALVKQLDAMSDAVLPQKIRGHQILLGRYGYADNDEGIRDHAPKLLALAQRALKADVLPKIPADPRSRGSVDMISGAYSVMLSAYSDMARGRGDYLHADSALMILDEGDRAIGTVYPYAHEVLERDRKMYRLVGTKATAIDGKWWINGPDGMTLQPGNDKVSIIQFTAHWCVPCKMSYEPMKRLIAKFDGKPVESVMTTGLYGYIGAKRNLTPEQEVEADREYYKGHYGLPFQISINPPPPRDDVVSNDARYAVGGIPEIIIVDRKGVIRATIIGWDKGNEQRFEAFVNKLLAEK